MEEDSLDHAAPNALAAGVRAGTNAHHSLYRMHTILCIDVQVKIGKASRVPPFLSYLSILLMSLDSYISHDSPDNPRFLSYASIPVRRLDSSDNPRFL